MGKTAGGGVAEEGRRSSTQNGGQKFGHDGVFLECGVSVSISRETRKMNTSNPAVHTRALIYELLCANY